MIIGFLKNVLCECLLIKKIPNLNAIVQEYPAISDVMDAHLTFHHKISFNSETKIFSKNYNAELMVNNVQFANLKQSPICNFTSDFK